MTRFITQKDQIIAQMRAELLATATEDRYYTEENITDCNAHLEAFLAQSLGFSLQWLYGGTF